MRIQKQFVSKRGDKEYHKYVVVIPEDKIKEAELKEGDELEADTQKGKIILRKK